MEAIFIEYGTGVAAASVWPDGIVTLLVTLIHSFSTLIFIWEIKEKQIDNS